MNVTAFSLAQRFIGVKELPGEKNNPFVMSMLQLDQGWPQADEVPWCSAFVNYIAWLLRLPRSKSLAARSWLEIGYPIEITAARAEYDVVILNRGGSSMPVSEGPGHVGFFAAAKVLETPPSGAHVVLLGGNQGNSVKLSYFPMDQVLGVRRLVQ